MSMGGGGGGGGSVVQYTDPNASRFAGLLGQGAANAASSMAQNQAVNAVKSINQQYAAATSGLRPYTQTGIQALDQLNQYLGLDPYKAIAPTNPLAPTIQNLQKGITDDEVKNYINQNLAPTYNDAGDYFGFNQYVGPGSENQSTFSTPNAGGSTAVGSKGAVAKDLRDFYKDPNVWNNALMNIAKNKMPLAEEQYQGQLTQYNTDLANYNQAQEWAGQYGTPLTQDQITNNITNQPGYAAELAQGTDAITKNAASRGFLGSGAILKGLMSYGQNTLSKYYNNTLANLSTIAQSGQSAATQQSNLLANQGNSLAGIYTQLGDTQANAALGGANALSQALIASNQKFKTVGGGGGGGGIGDALGGIGSLVSAFKPGGFF